MSEPILSYKQKDPVRLLCEIDLKQLLPAPKERHRFDKNLNSFLESDQCNKEIFERKGDRLKYQSEHLIPSKSNDSPPLLLVLGNPASHSVKSGMFFALEKGKKEHRFWKGILENAGVLKLNQSNNNASVEEVNESRKKKLLDLNYDSPFRIGLSVYISIPSASSGDWSGIAGVQKLIGAKALRRLEVEERRRIIECAKNFLSPNGIAVVFQKNAWNGLKSDSDMPYKLKDAKNGKLIGTLKGMPDIPLLCVPPTRRPGPCSRVLRQLLEKQIYNPEYLKPLGFVCDADPRSVSFSVLDPKINKYRTKELTDHYNNISQYALKPSVPEDIVIQFETAKNLYLYAWYVYRFYNVAEHHVLTCLEFALRGRFKDELPKEYWNKPWDPTLRPLLRYAIDYGYIENEGFQKWHQTSEKRATFRYEMEKIEEMNRKGLTEIELDFSEVEVTDQDRDWNYINILLKSIPNLRNHYAHGSTTLHNRVLSTIQIVKEIIDQIYPIRLQYKIDLKKLLPAPKERNRFDKNWNDFLDSDQCNKELFELEGDRLIYQSEQLIPSKSDDRPPLLLVLGNPASHSVKAGMFFALEKGKKEHRFWKGILENAGVLKLNQSNNNASVEEVNESRKKQLLDLSYDSPFRIGLSVYISIPSASSGNWSGIAGVQKLMGAKALRRLEVEESRRIIECAKKFLSPDGVAVAFQKNAWNGLKSDSDISYSIEDAQKGILIGSLKGWSNIPLLGVPPTRLPGPCSRVLRQLLMSKGITYYKKR